MNKKQIVLVSALSAVLVVIAVTAVSASSTTSSTPLYTLRMEQASSKMNFLPTETNGFVYNTEKGSTVACCPNGSICGGGGAQLMNTYGYTHAGWTCDATGCQSTCSTCNQPTCPSTCWNTCDDPSCVSTCYHTCKDTCTKPCVP